MQPASQTRSMENVDPALGVAVAEMEKGFQPFVGEGTTSPNRPLVERLVQHIVTRFPSFARALQKRCLGACGKLSLPVMFVSHYLQGSTGTIVLENPDGRTWRVEWSAWEQSGRRLALTAGWPEFARFHGAKIGDVILFEILDNSRFKFLFISPANTNGGSSSEATVPFRKVPQILDYGIEEALQSEGSDDGDGDGGGDEPSLPSSCPVDAGSGKDPSCPAIMNCAQISTTTPVSSSPSFTDISHLKAAAVQQTQPVCTEVGTTASSANQIPGFQYPKGVKTTSQNLAKLFREPNPGPKRWQSDFQQRQSATEASRMNQPKSFLLGSPATVTYSSPSLSRSLTPVIMPDPVSLPISAPPHPKASGTSPLLPFSLPRHSSKILQPSAAQPLPSLNLNPLGVLPSSSPLPIPIVRLKKPVRGGHRIVPGDGSLSHICHSVMYSCSQYCLQGFQFCLWHILEDPTAPYKQCDFVEVPSGDRCRFPVSLKAGDARFCQMHKHVNGFTLNPQTLRRQEEMENPPLGEFSILVLAATVAHHMDVVNPPKIWASAILNQPEWSVQAPEAAAATTTDIKDELGPSVSPQQAAKDFPRPAARAAIHTESSFLVKKPGGDGKTPEGVELSLPTAIAKNGGSAAGKSVTISDELELFRAQLGNRLTSHGITVPYSNLPQVIAADAAAPNHESGSSLTLRLGRLNAAAASTVVPPGSWAKARVPPVIPSLVDVGPVNLSQVGLSCNINNALQQFVTNPGSSGKRITEQQQLHIVPIMDLGGLDMTTMGVQCGPREPRATPGLAIKRKSKLPVPRDCTSLGRGQVTNELNIFFLIKLFW